MSLYNLSGSCSCPCIILVGNNPETYRHEPKKGACRDEDLYRNSGMRIKTCNFILVIRFLSRICISDG